MTTRSTPASSISGSRRSMVIGSGSCGVRPGTKGQSGVGAFHRWTCASTIMRFAGFAVARCTPIGVAKLAPTTAAELINLRRDNIRPPSPIIFLSITIAQSAARAHHSAVARGEKRIECARCLTFTALGPAWLGRRSPGEQIDVQPGFDRYEAAHEQGCGDGPALTAAHIVDVGDLGFQHRLVGPP